MDNAQTEVPTFSTSLLKIDDTANQVEEAILGTLKKTILNPAKLKIPSFAAVNSLVQDDINIGLTNVFKTPLVPGPASSYPAIFTALMRAQGLTEWSCGSGHPTVLSLDMDLYEKVFKLVNSRGDLRG